MNEPISRDRRRGRGASTNQSGRYESLVRENIDDGWDTLESLSAFKTTVRKEPARTIITSNKSPDVPFDQSINPYRGCEHGCVYCYARPTHTFLGHSAGLDFESQLYAKSEAATLLERELANPKYEPKPLALGTNTDPYQPIERRYQITRKILEVFDRTNHPATIVTKSANVLRDTDILASMAKRNLVHVALSVTTLDSKLARTMEPRASTPLKRIDAIKKLSEAGIPTTVMVAPIIPALTDHEIESILQAANEAGAKDAGFVLLRLPLEIKDLFEDWLAENAPNSQKRVLNHMRSMHAGALYNSDFEIRQRGTGPYANQIAQRFKMALRRLKMTDDEPELRTDLFTPPTPKGAQLKLI